MNLKNEPVKKLGTLFYVAALSSVVIMFFLFIALYTDLQSAHAETYKHIAITFSETCNALTDLKSFENCPDPNYVKSLFPETRLKPSYQLMFENAKQGEAEKYQRNNAILNHKFSCVKSDYCNVFDIKKGQYIVYWYEPDYKTLDYYDAIITINANIKHKNLNVKNDDIIDNGTARFIHLDTNQINIKYCRQVIYDPNVIEFELGRIVWYLNGNCADKSRLGYLSDPYVLDLVKTDLGNLSDSYAWYWLYNQTAIKEKYKEYQIGND